MYIHALMATRPQASSKTLVGDARAALETCAGLNSRLAARQITHFLDERLQASGITLAQFGLMAQLAAAGDDTLGAVAQRMGLDQSTLSRNLRSLEAAGLVEITVVERDQRRRAAWLTEEGARRLEAALPLWRAAHDALAKQLDPRLARRLARAAQGLGGDQADEV
jgi:DNA-binding MarR family transcriptional regulator